MGLSIGLSVAEALEGGDCNRAGDDIDKGDEDVRVDDVKSSSSNSVARWGCSSLQHRLLQHLTMMMMMVMIDTVGIVMDNESVISSSGNMK